MVRSLSKRIYRAEMDEVREGLAQEGGGGMVLGELVEERGNYFEG